MKEKNFLILFIYLAALTVIFSEVVSASYLINENDMEKPQLVLQTGHNQTVSRVVFSSDRKFLASASKDNTVKIWDVETGRELRSFTGHTAPVKALAISKDGLWMASGGNDKTVRIWSVNDGRQKHLLIDHNGSIETLAFSPDGKLLVSGGTDAMIKIWNATTGEFLYDLEGHLGWVTSLIFSSDSQKLASGSADRTVKVWEIGKNRKYRDIETHKDRVTALAFNNDGTVLASGASDGKIKISILAPKRESFTLSGHSAKILALGFLSGNSLISGDGSQTVKKWLVAEKSEVFSVTSNRSEDEEIEAASFDSNAELIAFGKGSRAIEIISASNGEKLNVLGSRTAGFYSVAFSHDGHWLASGSDDNTIKLFDLRTGQARLPLAGHGGYITCLKFTPDSRYLISAGIDSTIRIWDVIAGKTVRTLTGHQGTVNSIDITSDGKMLATASFDRTIRLWNLEKGIQEQLLKEHNDEITGIAFTADNRYLISGSSDGSVRVWDLTFTKQPRKLLTGVTDIEKVSISRNGVWLAVAAGNEIKLWNLTINRLVSTLPGHSSKIYALAFSPDSQNLASAGADNSIKIWEVNTGKEIRLLNGHTGIIHGLAYNQSGEWLVSNSEDGSTIIWKSANGNPAATLVSLRTGAEWLVVTPQGLFDGSAAAWNQILWRFGTDTFNTQPVEVFFNEFYLPGLLSEVLSNKPLSLPSGKDITKIDRRQPQVKILSVEGQSPSQNTAFNKRAVTVQVEVTENSSKPLQDDQPAGSGGKDLRLFRNGSLVKVWRGNVFTLSAGEGCRQVSEISGKPQRVICEINVPVVAGQNELSAYAFNHQNVKSPDGVFSVNGADNLKRQGSLYILAIGINRYENKNYNLNFAVADAVELGRELKRQQERLGIYTEPKVITLLDEEATKENILYAFSRFSGAASGRQSNLASDLSTELVEKLGQIKTAQPEDVILFYFAGHGFASENQFYLIPHNLGVSSETANRLQKLRASSVSDKELEEILEFIDAGKILFVIDACNSGQALEAEEKRRGPMNSRGLAQLAFEKGMYILTAAQSFQAALEVSRTPAGKDIKHGLLTYSLLEGLTSPKADADTDKKIIEREWFGFAVENVPQMQLEEMKMRNAEIDREGGESAAQKRSDIVFLDGDDPNKRPEERALQTPRVFYRREAAVTPFIVAKQ